MKSSPTSPFTAGTSTFRVRVRPLCHLARLSARGVTSHPWQTGRRPRRADRRGKDASGIEDALAPPRRRSGSRCEHPPRRAGGHFARRPITCGCIHSGRLRLRVPERLAARASATSRALILQPRRISVSRRNPSQAQTSTIAAERHSLWQEMAAIPAFPQHRARRSDDADRACERDRRATATGETHYRCETATVQALTIPPDSLESTCPTSHSCTGHALPSACSDPYRRLQPSRSFASSLQ